MALSISSVSAPDGRHSLAGTTSGFNSEIDEDEVDQLDSEVDDDDDGMEPEVEDEEESASAARGRRKLGARIPGHTLIPQDRLDNILQAEGAGPHMSKEAVYLLSIATCLKEEFVKKFAEAGYHQSISEDRQHLQYRDMANVANRRSAYKFLQETVPKPITIAEAMQLRAAKEREMLQDDPAITAMAPASPPFLPTQLAPSSISAPPAPRTKTRQPAHAHANGGDTKSTNGNESAHASASAAPTPTPSAAASESAAARSSRQRDRRGRWSLGPSANGSHESSPSSTGTPGTEGRGSARIRNLSARARDAAAAEAAAAQRRRGSTNGLPLFVWANGGRNASSGSGSAGLAQSPTSPGVGSHQEHWAQGEPVTGPASGYMEEGSRVSVNGRSPMMENPGRTIYSQQRPAPAQPR